MKSPETDPHLEITRLWQRWHCRAVQLEQINKCVYVYNDIPYCNLKNELLLNQQCRWIPTHNDEETQARSQKIIYDWHMSPFKTFKAQK